MANQSWLAFSISTLGISILLVGIYRVDSAERTQAWPSTSGQVISAYVAPYGGNSRGYYRTVVIYKYEVAGRAFESKRLSVVESYTNKPTEANAVANRFSPGLWVTVYYDPESPASAVLLPGLQGTIWEKYGTAIVGGFMFVVGVVAHRLMKMTLRIKYWDRN